VTASMLAPAGTVPVRPNLRVLGGKSSSVAVAVKVSSNPSLTVLLPIDPSTGAWFTSFTVTVTSCSSDKAGEPLSLTTTLNV
jgi:hypothetical protein